LEILFKFADDVHSGCHAVPWFLDWEDDSAFQEWTLHGGLRSDW